MKTFTEAVREIARLRALPIGWDYGRGGPSTLRSTLGAWLALQMLSRLGTTEFDIVPGTDGSIVLFGYQGNESVEIEAFTNGSYDFLHEVGEAAGELHSNLNIGDIAAKLEDCGWQSPRLYVSCTRGGMSLGSSDLPDLRFATLPVAAYQLSVPTALPPTGTKSVRTFGSSMTHEFAGTRRFSGEYQELRSQRVSA